jgi:hypothetical protein
MVNVILSSDEVTVLGGPTRLDVDLNIGASGTRGSIIFNGFGNPNNLQLDRDFPTFPLVFDIFIDSDPASDNYLQAYQYVNQDGQTSWVIIFKLTQDVYRINKVVEFLNGEGNVLINLTELGIENVAFESYLDSFAFFNVSATISNIDVTSSNNNASSATAPAALSVVVEDAYTNDPTSFYGSTEFPFFLPIRMEAAEFSSGTWSLINNKKVVIYLTVGFANPNEIFSNFGGDF